MKRLSVVLMLVVSGGVSYSQVYQTLLPVKSDEAPKTEVDNLKKDSTTLANLAKETGSPEIREKLAVVIARLQLAKDKESIYNVDLESAVGREELARLKSDLKQSALRISGEVLLRPTGGENNNFLTPAIAANYKSRVFPDFRPMGEAFALQYDVALQIQPPTTENDTAALVTRILSSGADGILQLGGKAGWVGDNNAFMIGVNGNINWLNQRAFANSDLSSFAFLSTSYTLVGKLGPVVLAYQQEFRFVPGSKMSLLARMMNNAMSGSILFTVFTETSSIGLRYLVQSNEPRDNNQDLEIRFGASYSPF